MGTHPSGPSLVALETPLRTLCAATLALTLTNPNPNPDPNSNPNPNPNPNPVLGRRSLRCSGSTHRWRARGGTTAA